MIVFGDGRGIAGELSIVRNGDDAHRATVGVDKALGRRAGRLKEYLRRRGIPVRLTAQ